MLCHSVTSQGFGALHFCEIGYEAVMGFVVVAVVVAVVVVEGQSEEGHCFAQHKRLLLRKRPCSYSGQTHQFFPNVSVIQMQESLP